MLWLSGPTPTHDGGSIGGHGINELLANLMHIHEPGYLAPLRREAGRWGCLTDDGKDGSGPGGAILRSGLLMAKES